ncbi:MAG TPA: neutral zinc metallopeptidase [Vicinamibacterales bacterium]|nr:neutral zinc metallopeptidase [Vicinamibacterales bacterium]
MRWSRGDRSNIEDRRGGGGFRGFGRGGGLGRGIPIGIGGFVVLLLLTLFTGTDFLSLLDGGGGRVPPSASVGGGEPVATSEEEEALVDMVDAVMDDAQETWSRLLGSEYQPTRAVLFRDAIRSACGFAESASGPFYCPGDRQVYLDLGFFDELHRRFGAPGDFAQAYVLAHELGHHVQALTGIEERVRRAQGSSPSDANALSVRMELQADCFAGVWAHSASQPGRAARGRVELEPGDVEEGLQAAAAIGDDRIQRMSGGRVFPDRFTHGSSEQRVRWFRRGLESGDPKACDTFGGR